MKRSDPIDGPIGDTAHSPTWLTEECPAWCAREHREHDHPEDRYHRSEPSIVPGIVAVRETVPVTDSLEGLDLIIWLGRYVGTTVTWLTIEPIERREPRLTMTTETARMLGYRVVEQTDRLSS
jgi:hypothetical protein